MSFSDWKDWSLLIGSQQWLLIAEALCAVAVLVTLGQLVLHFTRWRRESASGTPGTVSGWLPGTWLLVAAIVSFFASIWLRWGEVNHFPSQSLYEVLILTSGCLLISMLILHFALGFHRLGTGWAVMGDLSMLLVFALALGVSWHTRDLSTAQKDLPPALQSYWFAPHVVMLIFSYATLSIAALLAGLYFAVRFWSPIVHGGKASRTAILMVLAMVLLPIPKVQEVGIVLVGLVALAALIPSTRKFLPHGGALTAFEQRIDHVGFLAFAVGIPFLTAGLWFGAFWAQEAWANYWGWDSKENSALITWLIYVVYIHLRMIAGYRGEKALTVLMGGALSVFITFQLFGYLPDSQKSLHNYMDQLPTDNLDLDDEETSRLAPTLGPLPIRNA